LLVLLFRTTRSSKHPQTRIFLGTIGDEFFVLLGRETAFARPCLCNGVAARNYNGQPLIDKQRVARPLV
jgi:hypothetical protein